MGIVIINVVFLLGFSMFGNNKSEYNLKKGSAEKYKVENIEQHNQAQNYNHN